jgi:hypothetical protein
MTTVLLALGDNALRDACNAALHGEGHTTLVLDRPLAALSLASKLSWQVMLVDDTSLGREAGRTAGVDRRVVGIGAATPDVAETLPLPLEPQQLLEALARPAIPRRLGLTLDPQRRLARVDGHEAALTRIEFRLLDALYERRSDDVSLESLLETVWGTTAGVGTAELVRTHVRNLRQKLTRLDLPNAIRSHRGLGYALEP